MDADATERGRALEERVARLEARLRRLEGVAGIESDPPADVAEPRRSVTTAPPVPALTPAEPAPAAAPVAEPMYWQLPPRAEVRPPGTSPQR